MARAALPGTRGLSIRVEKAAAAVVLDISTSSSHSRTPRSVDPAEARVPGRLRPKA